METLVKTLIVEDAPSPSHSYGPDEETKRCPYCAELILAAAVKCKHCSEFLSGEQSPPPVPAPKKKWHQSNLTIFLAMLTMGPLALPMVWMNKRYRLLSKVIVTVLVLGGSFGLGYGAVKIYQGIFDQLRAMGISGVY
jgi:hypothetical protein